jgi:cell division transport system permease protein
MRSNNLGFFLSEAFKNMRLNLLMSVTAVTTTAVCVLILGMGLLVDAHVEGIVRNVGQDVAITAFFPEDIEQQRIDEVLSSVEGYPEVNESAYVSKEEALERFRETFAEQPDIAGSISSDVLPASIELQLNDSGDSSAVADRLRAEGFQDDEIRYPQQTVDRLNQITGYLIWGLRGATSLFFVASVLLIFNTIRLSIFARRKEIEVMKLVGASDSFVRTPFVLEGLVQGLIGALPAALLVVWMNSLFVGWAQENLPFFPISSGAVNALIILLFLLFVGALVGVAGSFFSVRRFLKV